MGSDGGMVPLRGGTWADVKPPVAPLSGGEAHEEVGRRAEHAMEPVLPSLAPPVAAAGENLAGRNAPGRLAEERDVSAETVAACGAADSAVRSHRKSAQTSKF